MQKFLLLLLLLPAAGLAEPLRVFASVVPIQTFVEQIGGHHVDARSMVRPGFDPHGYDPTPQQISALSGAVLYVRTGMPFEDAWMARIRSANQSMQVLDVRDGITLRTLETHDHDEHEHDQVDEPHADDQNTDAHAAAERHEEHHDQDHAEHAANPAHADEQDPHVWTSPTLVIHMVGVISDKLSALDPTHAADFARNHDAFVAELRALDRELHALLDPLPNRNFMVFHPAWGYFADTYRLTQVPIEHEGKEPGARALVSLIDQAKEENIKVIFVQPQFDKRQARTIAQAIGGTVIAVDPLGVDYINNLRRVGQQFAQALQP